MYTFDGNVSVTRDDYRRKQHAIKIEASIDICFDDHHYYIIFIDFLDSLGRIVIMLDNYKMTAWQLTSWNAINMVL